MDDCIFCRIAAGRLPARILYQDERAVAFEDISPQAPVHVLVIPREHIPTALNVPAGDSTLMGHLFQIASRIAREKGIAGRGFRLVLNTNPEAGQSVYHLHLHVLGGRVMHWPPG